MSELINAVDVLFEKLTHNTQNAIRLFNKKTSHYFHEEDIYVMKVPSEDKHLLKRMFLVQNYVVKTIDYDNEVEFQIGLFEQDFLEIKSFSIAEALKYKETITGDKHLKYHYIKRPSYPEGRVICLDSDPSYRMDNHTQYLPHEEHEYPELEPISAEDMCAEDFFFCTKFGKDFEDEKKIESNIPEIGDIINYESETDEDEFDPYKKADLEGKAAAHSFVVGDKE